MVMVGVGVTVIVIVSVPVVVVVVIVGMRVRGMMHTSFLLPRQRRQCIPRCTPKRRRCRPSFVVERVDVQVGQRGRRHVREHVGIGQVRVRRDGVRNEVEEGVPQ